MLKEKIKKLIDQRVQKTGESGAIELFETEKVYAEKHRLIDGSIQTIDQPERERFAGAYIERGDKETEEFLGEEKADFLQEKIEYFQTKKNEFMYLESEWFELVGVDAVSFEVDDVFETYDVMLGLKLQKKYASFLQDFFAKELDSNAGKFNLIFDGNEGLWNVNFALNDVPGFREDLTIGEAYQLIYTFLFNLAEAAELQS